MTLRARLAVAFFFVVLGPAALGAWALVGAIGMVGPPNEQARLSHAAASVRLAVRVECDRLRAEARVAANRGPHIAASVTVPALASASATAARPRWAVCGSSDPNWAPGTRYEALAARVVVRDAAGDSVGYSYATVALDETFFKILSATSGAKVTQLTAESSTAGVRAGIATGDGIGDKPADGIGDGIGGGIGDGIGGGIGDGIGDRPGDGTGVPRAGGNVVSTLRLAPEPDQPIPLRLSVAPARPADIRPVVLVVAVTAVLAASILAWWLSRVVTWPLAEFATAVDRASTGDLSVPPKVWSRDEFGRLGVAVGRLVAELGQARRLSVTDALTGLGNVRHLRDCLRLEVERASRFGHTLGVLALDLDRFKEINDRYGHRAGDAVLVEFADRLRGVVREVDLVFRQGGEEFVILLPETDLRGCETVAQRLGMVVRRIPFVVAARRGVVDDEVTGLFISITVSIGVAAYPAHAGTGPETLDSADEALYAAKAAGRDTYVLATPRLPG